MQHRMNDELRLTLGMQSDNPVVAARAYIRAGLKLLVIHGIKKGHCTCRNADCQHPGKHPIAEFFPHGAKSATSDISLIKRAFKKIPHANMASSLGGYTVVDIDGPAGSDTVSELDLPKTLLVKTSRGKHLWYFGSIQGGAFKADQIDILTGENRYVMLPPSNHESGVAYRWLLTKVERAASVPASMTTRRFSR